MRRDLDLIFVPWVENHATPDELAATIQKAACGLSNAKFVWEAKPCGRIATAFPICWSAHNVISSGHIDLSVMMIPNSEIQGRAAVPMEWRVRPHDIPQRQGLRTRTPARKIARNARLRKISPTSLPPGGGRIGNARWWRDAAHRLRARVECQGARGARLPPGGRMKSQHQSLATTIYGRRVVDRHHG